MPRNNNLGFNLYFINVNASKPLKRDNTLIPLSMEHHYGLLFTWKIKQGLMLNAPLAVMKDYVEYIWNDNISKHFKLEEQILLKKLEENDPMRNRVAKEHKDVKKLVKTICSEASPPKQYLKDFCELLNNHIRFEEREFFPYIEKTCSSEQLKDIGNKLFKSQEKFMDKWTNSFWADRKREE